MLLNHKIYLSPNYCEVIDGEPKMFYVDNIVTTVNAGKYQKIKCTVCSFKNNLTVTINSNLFTNNFEKEFYKLLIKYCGKVYIDNDEFLKGEKH